jgi:nitrogen fixation protein
MAEIKISQLPAKSANLAATDLLEVSEVSGLTYVSKKITGAELVGNVVPYTGATQDVDLGEYELKARQIELDQSPTGVAGVAVTRWNDSIGSTETTLKGGSVVLKNGVDLVARVVNKVTPNTTLTKADYKVVKISGAQGQRLAVDYAQANNDNNSADTLGVVIETIPTNQEGFIMTVGQLEGINTTGSLQGESWADGDVLYLSPTVPGAVTKVKPTGATGHIVIIGYVEYAHAINGKIYVKIMNGWELDELHNVYIDNGTLANNQVLTYNSSTSLWNNKALPCDIQLAASDETTALTAGTAKVTFRMPYAMTVTAVRASLTTAQTSGNILTVDINEGGNSILSTKLTIDNTEKTSVTAATQPVISDTALDDDAEMTIDIDQVGDGTAKGLKITIIGTRV